MLGTGDALLLCHTLLQFLQGPQILMGGAPEGSKITGSGLVSSRAFLVTTTKAVARTLQCLAGLTIFNGTDAGGGAIKVTGGGPVLSNLILTSNTVGPVTLPKQHCTHVHQGCPSPWVF